jgi:hypothetical protein
LESSTSKLFNLLYELPANRWDKLAVNFIINKKLE